MQLILPVKDHNFALLNEPSVGAGFDKFRSASGHSFTSLFRDRDYLIWP